MMSYSLPTRCFFCNLILSLCCLKYFFILKLLFHFSMQFFIQNQMKGKKEYKRNKRTVEEKAKDLNDQEVEAPSPHNLVVQVCSHSPLFLSWGK
jgi:hypothetical protein